MVSHLSNKNKDVAKVGHPENSLAPLAQNQLFVVESPADSTGVCGVMILALNRVLGTAVVETKDFVVQVETVAVHLESPLPRLPALRADTCKLKS